MTLYVYFPLISCTLLKKTKSEIFTKQLKTEKCDLSYSICHLAGPHNVDQNVHKIRIKTL